MRVNNMSYEILMSADMHEQFNGAIKDYIWSLKNPIYDQPKQKWYGGNGIYRVLQPFGELKAGDNVLLDYMVHTRAVKVASATEKQVFYNYRKDFYSSMEFTPEDWFRLLRALTKQELIDLWPHMSPRMKAWTGIHSIMAFYPENVCTNCMGLLKLKIRDGRTGGYAHKRCNNCGKIPVVVTHRHSLIPKFLNH